MAIVKNKKYYVDRLNELKGYYEGKGIDAVDRDKTRYMHPHGRNLDDARAKSDGRRKDEYILNNTVLLAVRTAVAGIFSGSVNPSEKWFRLADEDKELNETENVSGFYQKCTDILLQDMGKSNFYSAIEQVIHDLLTYSISCIITDEGDDSPFSFSHIPNGQYYIDVDGKGEVSALYRLFEMRARNVISEYGINNVRQTTRDEVKNGKTGGKLVSILHVIEKNQGRDVTKEDNQNMPWNSITYEFSGDDKNQPPLRKSGYITKPLAVPRWSVSSGNMYGNGPGDMALGDVKQLQKLSSLLMLAIEKEISPPVIGPEGININTGPNEITRFDKLNASGRSPVTPLYQVNPDISKLVALMIDTVERIKAAFFSNLFFAQGESDPRETATLTIAKQRELLRLLGPAIQRMTPELLAPIIRRCFDIKLRAGELPDVPEEIINRPLKIEIISSLTKAQELSIVTPIEEVIGIVGNAAPIWPEAVDKVDIQQAIDEIQRVYGIPAGVIRSDEVVEEIQRLRAERQIQDQQAIQAQQAIEGAQKLSQTDLSGDNALNAVLQGAQ